MIIRHLGCGIVSIEDLIQADKNKIMDWLKRVEQNTKPQGYTAIDENSELNEGGYKFEITTFDERPTRFNKFSFPGEPSEDARLKKHIDEMLYNAVLIYAKLFPVSASELTWRTEGHIAKYEVGQYIGTHSDCGLPYEEGTFKPLNLSPLYNTLTATVALNDDYEGGEVKFKSFGITAKPKAGTIMLYPSSYIGAHEVLPIVKGIRYSYLSWFCHGSERKEEKSMEEIKMNSLWMSNLKNDISRVGEFLKEMKCELQDYEYVPVGILSK